MAEKIISRIVLEVLGRPKEYVKESLYNLVEQMEKEAGTAIKSKDVFEAKEVEDTKNLFSSFANLELESEDLISFLNILFKYMPSNVEISSPNEIRMKATDINAFMNEVASRLHRYDEIAKTITFQRQILENKIKEIMEKTGVGLDEKGNFIFPKEHKDIKVNKVERKTGVRKTAGKSKKSKKK